MFTIDSAYSLFKDRAGVRGISSNVSPANFNLWFPTAELKFFNIRYNEYARTQAISDAISKWLSDAMLLNIPSTGTFPFFTGMNLLHVDSMSDYLVTTGTKIASLNTLVGGTLYTDGSYNQVPLTGGAGNGATAYMVIVGGIVKTVQPQAQGSGYAVGDTLTAANTNFGGTGSGFSIKVATLTGATKEYPVTRVEKNRVAKNLSSEYDAPTQEFAIYTQYGTSLQFYPTDIGFAKIVYLKQPVWSYWGYFLAGYIATLTGLVSGSGYTTGTYSNVPLTGGIGNSALATIVVSGGGVTSVTLTNPGKVYKNGDALSALAANVGGSGTGFTITVSSLISGTIRPIYDPATSIQPKWNDDDLSSIIDIALNDAAIAARDKELTGFAQTTAQSQQ